MNKKQQESKNKFGTLTATQDANGEYSSSMSSKSNGVQSTSQGPGMTAQPTATSPASNQMSSSTMQASNSSAKKQASKNQYGTLTAKADANNDYQ